MKEDALYWVGQKAFIRKGDEVLVIWDPKEGLDYPGGKIQADETDHVESLKREVREESGLEIEVGDPFFTWAKKFPPHHKHAGKQVYMVSFRCEYVSGEVTLSKDHDKFQWLNKDTYTSVDDGTDYFKALQKYFS